MISMGAATEVPQPLPGANGQWVRLLPKGDVRGRDGRGPWQSGDLESVIAASSKEANGRSLPIDYDHQIDLAPAKGGKAPAAGWISKMEARSDGIWGFVEWTPSGKAALDAREYRFLSPVFTHTKDGNISAILRAALTNNPNLSQLTALNSAGTSMLDDETMQTLCDLLSLPNGSDMAAVVQAIRDLVTSKNTVDPAKYVPIELFQQAVMTACQAQAGISRQSAEIEVKQAIRDHRILPFMHEWAVNLCTVNKPAFDAFMVSTGPTLHHFISGLTTLRDPSGLRFMSGGGSDAALQDGEMSQIMTRLGLTDDDVKKYGKHRA